MNAERLNAIATAVSQDLVSSKLPAAVDQLSKALQNQVNDPGEASYQLEVAEALKIAKEAADQVNVERYSPAWQQVLQEMRIDNLLAPALGRRLEEIFARNQITPSVALEEIQKIAKRLAMTHSYLSELVDALDFFKIQAEQLAPGECEIGILIPRAFVKNRLSEFSKELEQLNKIFGVFAELAIGKRPGFEIRTISSSDLTVYLLSVPAVCACVATAVEKIIDIYKKLLEVRKLQGELLKQGLDKSSLKGVEAHADGMMDAGINQIVANLMKEHLAADAGRNHELEIEVRHSLKKIATRIDRGFSIDVRMAELSTPESDAKETDQTAALNKNFHTIQDASRGMQFLKLEGDPLLTLTKDDPLSNEVTRIKQRKSKPRKPKTTPSADK